MTEERNTARLKKIRKNGTVIIGGDSGAQELFGEWRNVRNISSGLHHAVAAKENGTVTSNTSENFKEYCMAARIQISLHQRQQP